MSQTPASVTLDVVLRRALADRRMSGRHLADLASIPYGRIARTLRGERDLTVPELVAVAAALEITTSDLLTAEGAA